MDDRSDLRARAVALHDHFTHVGHDRRAFMADMVRLTGSLAAAQALAATIAADPAAAAIVADDDPRISGEMVSWSANGRAMKAYLARPKGVKTPPPAVVVIHENRGLQPYTKDVARRLAIAGFVGLAPDFLSPVGGTPSDEDAARDAVGKLDLAAAVQDGLGAIAWLKQAKRSDGHVGVVGFCWGGAMVNRLAVAGGKAIGAAAAFYGPAPDPAEAAEVEAPMLLHYAGLDDRVNATGRPWVAALKAAGKSVTAFTYPGVNHAFHNDTSAGRYDAGAAKLAWARSIAFFKEHLK